LTATSLRSALRLAPLIALLAAGGCGKRGDPLPPLRIVPQPVSDLSLSQRGGSLVLRAVAPRAATDGSRLPVLELLVERAEGAGDFAKLAKTKSVKAAPGEALVQREPLPSPGTLVRVSMRVKAKNRVSASSGIVSLTTQLEPPAPEALQAELVAAGVALTWGWTGPPVPAPPPPPAAPSPAPTATPTASAAAAASAAPAAAPTAPSSPAAVAPPPPSERPPASGPAPVVAPAAPVAAASPGAAAPSPEAAGSPPASVPSPTAGPSAAPTGAPTPQAAPTAPPTPKPPVRGFWIYRRAKEGVFVAPLNAQPLTTQEFQDASAPLGQEWCYVVRYVAATDPVIESADSNERCLAVRDVAPPAAPTGIAVLMRDGVLELSWSISPESDLAGYRVYRAREGQTPVRLAELTPAETVFHDHELQPGVAYVYTVTAFDAAGNESPPSEPAPVRP
jgi:Fibronectin type III domain